MRSADFLYGLLPAIYREKDVSRGEPLRALFAILQQQYDLLEDDIGALYHDWFVETCEPWVLPYIAELLGATEVTRRDYPAVDLRCMVANTLAFRRRKGLPATFEAVMACATGWASHVSEGAASVAMSATARRPRRGAADTVSMRASWALDRLGGAFDPVRRTAGVRSGSLYNLDRLGVFLWRLQGYPLRGVTAGVPAAAAAKQGGLTFHPLGRDMPLFNRPSRNRTIEQRTALRDVPAPLSRRMLADEIASGGAGRRGDERFLLSEFPAFAIFLVARTHTGKHEPVKAHPLKADEMVIADLASWTPPAVPRTARVAVDPERGRFMLLHPADRKHAVLTDHCYGFAGDIGGGPYPRPALTHLPDQNVWRGWVGGSGGQDDEHFTSLGAALKRWAEQDRNGIIEIADNRTYDLLDHSGAEASIALIERHRRLVIQAAPYHRPCLRGTLAVSAGTAGGTLQLDGLLIGGTIRISGGVDLTLHHCRIIPRAGQPAISASAGQRGDLMVTLEGSIAGPLRLPAEAGKLRISRSIVDGNGRAALAAPGGHAGTATAQAAHFRDAAPSAAITRATILGPAVLERLEASDSIFTRPLRVISQHEGYVRHCALPAESRAPHHQYACQLTGPALVEGASESGSAKHVRPIFTSLDADHPGYAHLSPKCPKEIRAGASDGAEMGVFHGLNEVQREENLRAVLEDYLPFNLEPRVIYAT
jgi:hypothetical protein